MNKLDYINKIKSMSVDELDAEFVEMLNNFSGVLVDAIYSFIATYIAEENNIDFFLIMEECYAFLDENIIYVFMDKCKKEHKHTLCDGDSVNDPCSYCDYHDGCKDCNKCRYCSLQDECKTHMFDYLYSCVFEGFYENIIGVIISNFLWLYYVSIDIECVDLKSSASAGEFAELYGDDSWKAIKSVMIARNCDCTVMVSHGQQIMFDFKDDQPMDHCVFTYGKNLIIADEPRLRRESCKISTISEYAKDLEIDTKEAISSWIKSELEKASSTI